MAGKASLIFAEFPEWEKLSSQEKNSIYEQMCQLWQAAEYNKAEQVFSYLFENDFAQKKLDEFAKNANGDFQYFYARKYCNILSKFELEKCRYWLKKAAENGCEAAQEAIEYNEIDETFTGTISSRLEDLNQKIIDAFYKNNKGDIFFGEQAAVLTDTGHIQFVKRALCRWNFFEGATGLILAKDEPVEPGKFKMTGFSPKLKQMVKKLAADENKYNCYPNIISYYPDSLEADRGDDFTTECNTWEILLELLEHGYSLVDKYEYTMEHSAMLPAAVRDQIEKYRSRIINSLMEDDDDDENEDDDDLDCDLDDIDLDDIDLEFEDDDEDDGEEDKK